MRYNRNDHGHIGIDYIDDITDSNDSNNSVNILQLISKFNFKKFDQMKIVQWYCCQCGKSYGDLDHFIISNDDFINLKSQYNRHPNDNHDDHIDVDDDISNDEINFIMEKLTSKLVNRFDCNRCSHMMCPYCIKARLGDLLRKNYCI
ncbi:unnamed protein product [[Candida] boidinii]|nr:unnamed protein product [[Candida] boidinii]